MKNIFALLLTTSIAYASDDIYCHQNTKTCPAGSIIIAYEFRTVGLYCDFDKQMVTIPSAGINFDGGVMCVKRYKARERKS